jgi:hypothetical protein
MIHRIYGSIVIPRGAKGYDPDLANNAVRKFMSYEYDGYTAQCDALVSGSVFYRKFLDKEPSSRSVYNDLLILVTDKPHDCIRRFSEPAEGSGVNSILGDTNRLSQIVLVESKRGVSSLHTKEAREIYDATRKICGRLKRKIPKLEEIQFFFDDGNNLYLPSQFRDAINSRLIY